MNGIIKKTIHFLTKTGIGRAVSAVLLFLIAIKILLLISLLIIPLPWERINEGFSRTVRASDGSLLKALVSENGTYRFHSSLSEISPYVRKGFVRYEDRYFWLHPGFNPISIVRAFFLNSHSGDIKAGGSTITMQIARMMEPKPRTYGAKFWELLRALQLETAYPKKRLLEIYLNMVPMGGNLEGVSAASLAYFGKNVSELGPGEAAILIGIPKSPAANRPFRDKQKTEAVKQRIVKYLLESGVIKPELYEQAYNEPLPDTRKPFPFEAPHLVMRMLERRSHQQDIKLTLDLRIQKICELATKQYLIELKKKRVHNLSIIVIDNRTMSVLAYVGSPDFFDKTHQGQVDGIISPRSPGSTLKPFIYGRAFDRGLYTPGMIIYDIPKSFKGYSPQNYGLNWNGAVTVRKALVNSFNMPAVETLWLLSPSPMSSFLESIGVNMRKTRKDLGLSVALGAYPVSLENMAQMYSSIANEGKMKKLCYIIEEKTFPIRRIMSPAAAWLVADILSGLTRPDLPASWEYTRSLPKVAWKTGTSFGLSDAWSIGLNPDYTIGVWVGNFSGRGSPVLVGIETATPLLFMIFNELSRGSDKWFKQPSSVGTRQVCVLSGLPPSPQCSTTMEDYYIQGVSTIKTCDIHKSIFVDKEGKYAVCDDCYPREQAKTLGIIELPPDYATWLRENNKPVPAVPSHNPKCERYFGSEGFKIKSPANGTTYYLRRGETNESQSFFLEVNSPADSELLYWFVDKKLVATVKPGTKVKIRQEIGDHVVTCMDKAGRSDEVRFRVVNR